VSLAERLGIQINHPPPRDRRSPPPEVTGDATDAAAGSGQPAWRPKPLAPPPATPPGEPAVPESPAPPGSASASASTSTSTSTSTEPGSSRPADAGGPASDAFASGWLSRDRRPAIAVAAVALAAGLVFGVRRRRR
jgi:hypothetical protein